MADLARPTSIARTLQLSAAVNTLDPDISKTQATAATLGPLYRVGHGPVRWSVVPLASTAEDAAPTDGLGLLVDAALVQRHEDAAGTFLGYTREASTLEDAGVRTGHWFTLTDASRARGDLVYLSVLSYDNPGSVAAMRIVAIDGLTVAT